MAHARRQHKRRHDRGSRSRSDHFEDGPSDRRRPPRVRRDPRPAHHPVPLAALVPGAVLWATVPFLDGDGCKERPVVVASVVDDNVLVLPITSSARRLYSESHPLDDWQHAGLARPSALMDRIIELDYHLDVLGTLGNLSERDQCSASRWMAELESLELYVAAG